MPSSPCLHCGRILDGATNAPDQTGAPEPGALSVCVYCSAVTIFGDDLRLRPLTEGEVEELRADPELFERIAVVGGIVRYAHARRN
jgi:hypothetical protein